MGRRLSAVQVFSSEAKTLAEGGSIPPEHDKTEGSPGKPSAFPGSELGESAQYLGLKAFFNLKK